MPAIAKRLLGPALLSVAVAGVWAGVGLAPMKAPQLSIAASSREVPTAPTVLPDRGQALAMAQAGDRVRLTVRANGRTSVLDLAPGVRTTGVSLRQLRAALRAGEAVPVALGYDASGAVVSVIAGP